MGKESKQTEEARIFGVAHTPIEVVDFMVQSAVEMLGGADKIKVLDPFTGDGVFIGSLAAHGVREIVAYEIRREQCAATALKYADTACVDCCDAFRTKPRNFNLIIGNSPYGKVAQSEEIDARIRKTYSGTAKCQVALFDAYIRAIRWASDNLESGIIAYILNSGFLDGIAFANFRKSIAAEFDEIKILNLRGNHRTSGETCRKEGGNVFGQECRTGIAILCLVRK